MAANRQTTIGGLCTHANKHSQALAFQNLSKWDDLQSLESQRTNKHNICVMLDAGKRRYHVVDAVFTVKPNVHTVNSPLMGTKRATER